MITISETRDHTLVATLNEEVQALHAQWYPAFKPYDKAAMTIAIKQMLEKDGHKAYVAYADGVPVGSLVCYVKEIEENAFHYHIKALYIDQVSVLKKYQGQGIGKMLLQQAEQLAGELHIQQLQLDHWSANAEAAQFFRANGYVLSRAYLTKMI